MISKERMIAGTGHINNIVACLFGWDSTPVHKEDKKFLYAQVHTVFELLRDPDSFDPEDYSPEQRTFAGGTYTVTLDTDHYTRLIFESFDSNDSFTLLYRDLFV